MCSHSKLKIKKKFSYFFANFIICFNQLRGMLHITMLNNKVLIAIHHSCGSYSLLDV